MTFPYENNEILKLNEYKCLEIIFFQDDIDKIFKKADKKGQGSLKVDDFKEVVNDIIERYPQVELYLKKKQLNNFVQLLKNSQADEELDIEKFKSALSEVDSQMKMLPATAQVCILYFRYSFKSSTLLYRFFISSSTASDVSGGCSRRQIPCYLFQSDGGM